jgi:hypothetical protein
MSYIGNSPTSVAFLTDSFSGNGSQTAFTLTQAPANTSSILVAISGVLQDPSTYSVSGTTLTFSPAPPTGTANISVRFLGVPASGVTTTAYRTVTEFTATAGQTSFSVPSYTVGYIDVYRNGVMLGSADYTATSGLTVVLANGCTAGDLVEVISFQVSSVLNAIPNAAGSVSTNNLADNSVTTAKIAPGAVIPADLSTGGPFWDASGNIGVGTTSPSTVYGAKLAVTGGNIIADFDKTIGFQWSGGLNQYFKGISGVPQLAGGARGLHVFNYDNDASQGIRFWGGTFTSRAELGGFENNGNFQFNSGYGSVATAYGCRAWVCFRGDGTVAIQGAGNVSSITDIGLGSYAVNFSTAMVDTNYACVMGQQRSGTSDFINEGFNRGTSSTRVETFANGSGADFPRVQLAFFR